MGRAELESSLSALDIWLIIFGLFVAVGVVGESVVGFLHWRRSGQLQTLQTSENLAQRASIADANARADEATAEAAKAQLELAKLKTPRTLTPDQQKRIADKIRPLGQTSFDVASTDRKEPLDLVIQIEDAVVSAGWNELAWNSNVFIARPNRVKLGQAAEMGITVQVEKPQEAKLLPIAKALASALRDEGIAAEAQFMPVPQTDNHESIHIVVGEKP